MDPKDIEIEARLQRLRNQDQTKPNTTEDQLAARLANLKGSANRQGVTDSDLTERLANVKAGNKAIPSECELEERLAKIKGGSVPSTAAAVPSNTNILITVKKTEAEQVNDLLKQMVTETDIDSHVTSSTTRLQDARNPIRSSKDGTLPRPSSSSTKQDTMAYVEKLVAEAKLTPYHQDGESSSSEEDSNDVDDWCTICNEDAAVRCKGCSGDLYCTSCYREFHTPSDTEDDHRCEKFVKQKKKTRETAL
uniref:Abscission/NoCut checkpoint regulator n=1 Tax=Cacopsylla melanoneura TaxID=428564 RepID=A0A8D9ATG4_9HEMI